MAYSSFQLAQKYIHFYFTASNGRGHNIHSPFVYEFVRNVLMDKTAYPEYAKIESSRRSLLQDRAIIGVEDLGAGSAMRQNSNRSVRDITRYAAKKKKYSQLLFRMARYYKPQTILELGTSVGVTTAYFAAACPASRIITFEGAPAVARRAQQQFSDLGFERIEQVTGNFDTTLSPVIQSLKSLDFSFVDGNHRSGPTLDYFENILSKTAPASVIIFDDIHWSADMEKAWDCIKRHPRVLLTVDLFFMGLVFFRGEFRIPQHFRVRF